MINVGLAKLSLPSFLLFSLAPCCFARFAPKTMSEPPIPNRVCIVFGR